jgi:uncharacterized protein
MNEDLPQGAPPEQSPLLQPLPRLTVLERLEISPVVFGFLVLGLVFILYQVVGGVLTFFFFGLKPLQSQATGFRIATGISQVIFIFIPTLLLVRFATFSPGEYLRVKFPDFRLIGLAFIGIFSLQQILQIIIVLQDKIPVPDVIERFLAPLKEMIEGMYLMLVNSTSVPELLLVLFIVAFIPAIAEEFLFRGLVQRSFERVLGPWGGVVLAGIIFGAYHLNPFSFIPLVLLGVYLGFLAMRSESIWTSVSAHFFNNAAACVAVYLHFDDDALVTGDPASMPLSMLLMTVAVSGVIFAISTYVFLQITKKTPPETIEFPSGGTGIG